jgi:hypothetical protein
VKKRSISGRCAVAKSHDHGSTVNSIRSTSMISILDAFCVFADNYGVDAWYCNAKPSDGGV